jgi:hypothetical protein
MGVSAHDKRAAAVETGTLPGAKRPGGALKAALAILDRGQKLREEMATRQALDELQGSLAEIEGRLGISNPTVTDE